MPKYAAGFRGIHATPGRGATQQETHRRCQSLLLRAALACAPADALHRCARGRGPRSCQTAVRGGYERCGTCVPSTRRNQEAAQASVGAALCTRALFLSACGACARDGVRVCACVCVCAFASASASASASACACVGVFFLCVCVCVCVRRRVAGQHPRRKGGKPRRGDFGQIKCRPVNPTHPCAGTAMKRKIATRHTADCDTCGTHILRGFASLLPSGVDGLFLATSRHVSCIEPHFYFFFWP